MRKKSLVFLQKPSLSGRVVSFAGWFEYRRGRNEIGFVPALFPDKDIKKGKSKSKSGFSLQDPSTTHTDHVELKQRREGVNIQPEGIEEGR